MRMTPKCISPGRSSLLSSKLVYPLVFLTSPLIIWLKYSSHLTTSRIEVLISFPPQICVSSSLLTSANGTTIYPVVKAIKLESSLIPPFFPSHSTYNPSPSSVVSTSKIYLKYFYLCSSSSQPFHPKLYHFSSGWLQQFQPLVPLSICLSYNNLSALLQM